MAESPAAPQLCSQCNAPLDPRRVTITEHTPDSAAVSDWTLCSWTCAREHVIRMVRLGRDDQ